MAIVQVLSAARMLAIEAASVISGAVVGDQLILTKKDGSTINAGNVRGATGPNPRMYDDLARASALLNMTAANADIAGCSLPVPVGGTTDVYKVIAVVDAQSLGTTGTSLLVELMVDGVIQTGQVIWNNNGINGARGTVSQQWRVTGLAAGTKTFKLQGRRSGGADLMVRANGTHTTMSVELTAY